MAKSGTNWFSGTYSSDLHAAMAKYHTAVKLSAHTGLTFMNIEVTKDLDTASAKVICNMADGDRITLTLHDEELDVVRGVVNEIEKMRDDPQKYLRVDIDSDRWVLHDNKSTVTATYANSTAYGHTLPDELKRAIAVMMMAKPTEKGMVFDVVVDGVGHWAPFLKTFVIRKEYINAQK